MDSGKQLTDLQKVQNTVDSLCAILIVIQCASEIELANKLATLTPEQSARFKTDFVKRFHQAVEDALPDSCFDEQREAKIIQLTIIHAEGFIARAAERESQIRRWMSSHSAPTV